MISRSRRKHLLLEIMSETEFTHEEFFLPINDYNKSIIINNLDTDFVFNDRFSIHLETGDLIIGPDKIKGFRIDNNIEEKQIIKIKTRLHIEDDIDIYKKVKNIKIYFYDNKGNMVKSSFDYEVDFKGFHLLCDYTYRDYLTPIYEFEILDMPFL